MARALGDLCPRLIPARAGKTHGPGWLFPGAEAHPRAGGENVIAAIAALVAIGSSPRGRGKLIHTCRSRGQAGLIPARAGKTVSNASESTNGQAHPRAGGENPTHSLTYPALTWLIPARAGKTESCGYNGAVGRAHPRAGGENTF